MRLVIQLVKVKWNYVGYAAVNDVRLGLRLVFRLVLDCVEGCIDERFINPGFIIPSCVALVFF